MTRCRICCCTDTHACPGGCSWREPDLCDVCADVTPAELAAAREVAFRVKDHGPSPTKDLTRYAHAVAGAVRRVVELAQADRLRVAIKKTTRKRKP